MENKPIPKSSLPPAPVTNNWHNAEGGIQAQVIENVNIPGVTPDMLRGALSQLLSPAPVSHAMEWASLDKQSYCLFVLEEEVYNGTNGTFSVAKACALREPMCEEIIEKYRELNAEQKEAIKKMPCIFARRNEEYKNAGVCQVAYIGRLTDIYVQDETIKFYFTAFASVSQQLLNEQADDLGIWHVPLRNELDYEHWSIINRNLIQALAGLGVSVL